MRLIPTVDLFSGLGGWEVGAKPAGYRVVWAGNHFAPACECYLANHGLRPKCQDLHQANWEEVPSHEVLLASAACTGHTRARGKEKAGHDAARSTAWAVVSCAEYHRPALVVVENVVEFLKWSLYPAWKMAMEALGYAVSPHVLDAADHGVPQNRLRVFIVMTRSRRPLILKMTKCEHIPANHILADEREWTPVKSLCANTRASIAAGRQRFGRRFLKVYNGSGTGRYGRSVHRPFGTFSTHDRFALVDGEGLSMLTLAEVKKGMGFPDAFWLPPSDTLAKKLLGNAVCPPVVRDLLMAARRAA